MFTYLPISFQCLSNIHNDRRSENYFRKQCQCWSVLLTSAMELNVCWDLLHLHWSISNLSQFQVSQGIKVSSVHKQFQYCLKNIKAADIDPLKVHIAMSNKTFDFRLKIDGLMQVYPAILIQGKTLIVRAFHLTEHLCQMFLAYHCKVGKSKAGNVHRIAASV